MTSIINNFKAVRHLVSTFAVPANAFAMAEGKCVLATARPVDTLT